MSEEEKKLIETFKKGYGLTKAETEILSNLIEKQQKEIEDLKQCLRVYANKKFISDEHGYYLIF